VTHTESVLISENDEPISTFSDEITHQEAAVHEPEKTQQAQQHAPTKSLPHEVSVDAELVAVVHLSAASSGEHLRQFLMRIVNLDKPIAAYGLNEHQVWHSLTREQEAELFTKAVYSLQLADRAGPVSAETLQAFQKVMDEIAYELSAQVEYLGAADTLAFAQDLDTFCLDVDKTVSLHLVNGASGRFTGTKFKGLAEANGLKLKEDGLFYSLSPDGNVLFSVVNVEKTPFTPDMLKVTALKGVTFQMEIARTPDCTEVFNRMAVMARSMASSLNSVLVDDHQRELPDAQIEKIRQQLKLIQVQMTVKGIPPGSPLALRLFS
jgi:FtsZ-interacting cell division protein ZipA